MKNIIQGNTVAVMELVAEIAAARVGHQGSTLNVEEIDKLVRTLFSTMCELLDKENEGN